MRDALFVSKSFILSACLVGPAILLQARPATPPAPLVASQGGQGGQEAPGGGRGGRGGMALSSETPLADTENLDAYPAAPNTEELKMALKGIRTTAGGIL